MTYLILPEPIARYFDADKRDADALIDCFTKQAVVTDEGRTHTGLEAIAQWKSATSAQYEYTVKPVTLEEIPTGYVVKGLVTGNFPGSPVELSYVFGLAHGKIASLEIRP